MLFIFCALGLSLVPELSISSHDFWCFSDGLVWGAGIPCNRPALFQRNVHASAFDPVACGEFRLDDRYRYIFLTL